jgi:tetratricopeptide (TPR) repeat protein
VEKEAGNAAFSAKRYEEAIKHFTKCIQLDPG